MNFTIANMVASFKKFVMRNLSKFHGQGQCMHSWEGPQQELIMCQKTAGHLGMHRAHERFGGFWWFTIKGFKYALFSRSKGVV